MQVHRARLTYLLSLICLTFAGIIFYLSLLQLVQMPFFLKLSQQNFQRQESSAAPRGVITDVHGIPLATNRPVYSLSWQGTGEIILNPEQKKILEDLETLFTFSSEHVALVEKKGTRLILANDISFDQVSKISELIGKHPNIIIDTSYQRQYPHKNLACHIVGYLGLDSESPGKMGLERICHSSLQGQSGKILNIRNSIGRHIRAHKLSQAYSGRTVQTTLDAELQRLAQELFPKDAQGCFILMDESGALEVVLSCPGFDPSIFSKPLGVTQWKQLQEKQGFLNRCFNASYPPASLFKLISLAAALDTNLISPETTWQCIGHITFKGRTYHCNKRAGHGIISTEYALAHSCNIPFFEIGKKIGIDTLAQYAYRFGLGQKTGIVFPELSGLVPTNAWKQRVKKEPWWQGETLSAVIGQSSLLVTPLQIACMISALCTGQLVRPRIINDEAILSEPLNLKAETLLFLNTCLESVIKKGTGRYLQQLKDFTIRGKTGTAQLLSLSKKSFAKNHLSHGYFAAHFQYKQEKPRTMVILVEHAGSASVAMRTALNFFKRYASLVDQRKRP